MAAARTGPGAIRRPDGTSVRVLVVDDDVLTRRLRREGWDVASAGDGKTALALAREFAPDAAVLDIMLPDLDGFELLRRIRAHVPDMHALFLTARDSLEDRVTAFVAGACLSNPFSLDEVVARVRTMLLRSGVAEPVHGDPVIRVGDLALDEERHEVRRSGELVDLTSTEFTLLRYLMSNHGRVLSKAEILFAVWNYDFAGASDIVELYVAYLRRKIDNGVILTVPDAGYLLQVEPGGPGAQPAAQDSPLRTG